MGDRANIVVRDRYAKGEREAVFLYSHWGGYELPDVLRKALARNDRWGDDPYLARIVFEEMIEVDRGGATGFGIATRMPDNEHDLLVLANERVYRLSEEEYRAGGFAHLDRVPSIAFADYIEVSERTWDNLTDLAPIAPPA
jgi:hypothetical protein